MSTTTAPVEVPTKQKAKNRRGVWIGLLASAVVLGCFVVWLNQPGEPFEIPPFETATMKVIIVDGNNERVSNVQLTPRALRPLLEMGSHYSWSDEEHGEPVTVTTDQDGVAEVTYPKWVDRSGGLLIGKITLVVEHPDFCVETDFDAEVPQPNTLVAVPRFQLQPGGRFRITAYRDEDPEPLKDFQTQIAGEWVTGKWNSDGPALVSPVISPGQKLIRVVDSSDADRPWFSEEQSVTLAAGQVTEIEVRLQPGRRISGRLSDSVPRPVQGGTVVFSTYTSIVGATRPGLSWECSTTTNDDGEFEFPSVPSTKEVRLLAWCDGYVSKMPAAKTVPPTLTRTLGRFSLPQFFQFKAESTYEVQMEPAARCEFKVQNRSGIPMEGVEVWLYPNILSEEGSSSFGLVRQYDKVISPSVTFTEYLHLSQKEQDAGHTQSLNFSAKTNQEGVAVIGNIPPHGAGTACASLKDFVIQGSDVPPFKSDINVALKSGKTTPCQITLVPKPKLTARMLRPRSSPGLQFLKDIWSNIRTKLGI